jgi:tRNA (mo5U34)-methyltransferase
MLRDYLQLILQRGRLLRSMARVSLEEKRKMIQRVEELGPWFHNYELADGVWTNPHGDLPGFDYPARRWAVIAPMVPDVRGKSCLDVGCSSGFFSLKLKELGAREVVGIDDGEQRRAIAQARFAAAQLGHDIAFSERSIYELSGLNRTFDVVICLGVLYHLRHPLLAIEQLRTVCSGTLLFQTITTRHKGEILKTPANVALRDGIIDHPSFPMLKFIEGELNNDSSNWFVPNAEAVVAMLRSCGFSIKEMVSHGDSEITVRCEAV